MHKQYIYKKKSRKRFSKDKKIKREFTHVIPNYCSRSLKPTTEQLGPKLNPGWIWAEAPEKGAAMYTSVSICCQHKTRFEAQHQSQRASELEHLLFWGCLAAYPLTSFIKSPWKNCPQKNGVAWVNVLVSPCFNPTWVDVCGCPVYACTEDR